MVKFIASLLALMTFGSALAAPLTTASSFSMSYPSAYQSVPPYSLAAKGVGTNSIYMVEVDPVSGALPVQTSASPPGRTSTLLLRNDYTVTSVTTTAYVQIAASTPSTINKLYIFDSSGSGMILATGALGSEVNQLYIPPGGSGAGFELSIPAGTRLSLKGLDVNASSGQFILTGLN